MAAKTDPVAIMASNDPQDLEKMDHLPQRDSSEASGSREKDTEVRSITGVRVYTINPRYFKMCYEPANWTFSSGLFSS